MQGTPAEVSEIHHGIIWVGSTLATEDDFDEARDAIVACQGRKAPTLAGCVFLVMALDDCLDAVEECKMGVQINTKALDIEVTDFSSDLMRIDNVVGNVAMSDFMFALEKVFDGKEDQGWAAGAYRNGSTVVIRVVIKSVRFFHRFRNAMLQNLVEPRLHHYLKVRHKTSAWVCVVVRAVGGVLLTWCDMVHAVAADTVN